MIRAAKSADAFRLAAIIAGAHSRSIYADRVNVDAAHARRVMAQMAHRHGGTHEGATCLFVWEQDGEIEGLMAGMLDRVYHVGDKLCANDVFLVATEKASARAANRLLDAYIDWAASNPLVLEINLSWADTLPSGQKMPAVYARKGFRKCGEIFVKELAA